MLTITPSTVSVAAGATQQFSVNQPNGYKAPSWEVNSIVGGNASIGTITQSGLYTAPIGSAQSVTVGASELNGTEIALGQATVAVAARADLAVTPSTATLTAGSTQQFSVNQPSGFTVTGWQVNGIAGGNASVGTVSSNGLYTAPNAVAAQTVTVTAVESNGIYSDSGIATAGVIGAGQVTATANGQVASYSISLPATVASFSVEFGQDTSYGRSTWSVTAPSGGGTASVLVAGMMQNTGYHMRADIALAGSSTVLYDSDHSFTTTQSMPTSEQHPATTIYASYPAPQPGVELMTSLFNGAIVYDLNGNMIWGYPSTDAAPSDQYQPVRQLPNGHMLFLRSQSSSYPITGPTPSANAHSEIKEVGLDNTLYNDVTLAQIQTALNAWAASSGYKDNQGNVPVLTDLHHEVNVNPTTGHWLVLSNYLEARSDVTGYPANQIVLGDVVLDLDPSNNFAVTWIWNEFDHLDVNRHPFQFPDWTHSNAIVYSPNDGNILVSSRHQSWVMKVQYKDGTGDGTLLWRLGYQGDFTLQGGTEPQDWNNGQHLPSFTTSNSTGVFGLTMMDNGTYRMFSDGSQCTQQTISAQCYSRTPQFTVDESAMTVTLVNGNADGAFAVWGGNAELLANGDIEGDFAGIVQGTEVIEVIPGPSPVDVWVLTNGTYDYRGQRIQSLYPGVQWSGMEDADAMRRRAQAKKTQ